MRSIDSRSLAPAYCALLCALGLLAAACGGDAAPPDAPADEAVDTAEPPEEGDRAEDVAGNLTEGCVADSDPDADYFPDKVRFDEAAGVSVAYEGTYKVVDVTPPQAPDADPVRYVLLQCGVPEPELEGELAGAQLIEVPVETVITLTTTNLPHFDELEAVDRLVGVGTLDFVATEAVLERGDELGEFVDETGAADLERLVATAPDLLLLDGFGDTILDDVARYVDAGVPTAINADFNEQTLLGRAEWVKFTSLFLNAEARANAVYAEVVDAYEGFAALAADVDERPKVLVNTPFEGTWFTPGGASFLAGAIGDAGGEYAFADDDSVGSLQVDIETVLDRAADADVWIQAGSVHGTLDDLLATDERFAEFEAFQDGEVWAYDAWTTPGGGYAVLEVAYLRADWFLADLLAIFHPEVLPDHAFTFFGRVPEKHQ
jgi:iron complex transport system substrate-binding protein